MKIDKTKIRKAKNTIEKELKRLKGKLSPAAKKALKEKLKQLNTF